MNGSSGGGLATRCCCTAVCAGLVIITESSNAASQRGPESDTRSDPRRCPDEIEFWQGDTGRRHHRLRYEAEDGRWFRTLLWP
ncbi:MAG: pyridoxine 5'-phosphate oxidase C-terminal domain-containing protein [Pseudonocardiaceae bacterium]